MRVVGMVRRHSPKGNVVKSTRKKKKKTFSYQIRRRKVGKRRPMETPSPHQTDEEVERGTWDGWMGGWMGGWEEKLTVNWVILGTKSS